MASPKRLPLAVFSLVLGCGLFEDDADDEMIPEITGSYEIDSYRHSDDCQDVGDPLDPTPYSHLELEPAGEGQVSVVPCQAEDQCGIELLHGAYYQGGGVWQASRRMGTTPSTGKCRLTFEELTIVADGPDVSVSYVRHTRLTDFVPVLNPCKSDEASDALPCVEVLEIDATLVE